jgi:hypothetical protein
MDDTLPRAVYVSDHNLRQRLFVDVNKRRVMQLRITTTKEVVRNLSIVSAWRGLLGGCRKCL